MTDLQKNQIISMRKQSITYAAISDALGIPVNTIKTFCRRNGMTKENNRDKAVCKNCGCKITNTPGARPRLFCSDHCRQVWWNRHRSNRVSEKLTRFTCLTCGKVFMDYGATNRKYCSQKCYREGRLQNEK